jgi:hypothetical protein
MRGFVWMDILNIKIILCVKEETAECDANLLIDVYKFENIIGFALKYS